MFAGCKSESSAPPDKLEVQLQGRTFEVEVAYTPEAMTQGLMHRAEILPNGGMIFLFPESRVLSMWMKNCLTDIDVIFVNPAGIVTATHAMKAEPLDTPDTELAKYSSGHTAQFAIELRGGMVAELGVKAGDRLDLPLEDLKAWAGWTDPPS
ncbi:MAG: DUF192 domain-containing protein [Planctomycetota bacterium]